MAPAPTSLAARSVIPRIGIDTPVAVKGLDPNAPGDVAWYDFTARPGQDGNAAFSGHADYHDYGPAVFARPRDVADGGRPVVRYGLPEET
jgi:sortase (surface protein transpeptidase)